MKRILFMHQASTIGGGSYCLLNVVSSLDRNLFLPIVALNSYGPLVDEFEALGIKVVIFHQMAAIPYNHTMFKVSSIKAYKRVENSIPAFKKILQDHCIDIVYLNNMMIYRYLKPAKECGCKTIMHVREHWPLEEHKIQLKWARKAVASYCDELIAINRYSASIFPDKPSTIIYDWIDFSHRFEPRSMSEIFEEDMEGKRVYLFTGGTARIKGAFEVISTFSKCVSDTDARLLVLGYDLNKPLQGYRTKLKKLLYRFGFDINEMKILNIIKKDSRIHTIPSTYKLVDIIKQSYCMLSYFTIPHANLAMAECITLGTPVIAALTDEALEYSDNGRLAILYPIGDIKAFEQAVSEFNGFAIQDSEAAKIAFMFSKEENMNRLLEVCNKL